MKCFALFVLAFVLALPAHAQIKDSYYYMRDDGVQSPEEMQMEAQTVFETCDANVYQRQYFNCQCLAGAFLLQREKYGGVAPQEELMNDLTIGKNVQCANTEYIAGKAFRECMEGASVFREYEKDNNEYCSCVGNTVARQFKNQPFLNTDYITDIHAKALVRCNQRDANNKPLSGQN